MCDFCHGTRRHRDACPRREASRQVEDIVSPDEVDDIATRAQRARQRVDEADRALRRIHAGIRRDG